MICLVVLLFLFYVASTIVPTQIGLLSKGNFSCPSKGEVVQPGDLSYPSFSVSMKAKNVSVTLKRTVTNVGYPTSDYTVQINNPKGVEIIVKPKRLSFERSGEKLSHRVSFVALEEAEDLGEFWFGSVVWVSGKYRVRSPVAVTWLLRIFSNKLYFPVYIIFDILL